MWFEEVFFYQIWKLVWGFILCILIIEGMHAHYREIGKNKYKKERIEITHTVDED